MTFLAARYLLARKRQTLFTLLGVFFGTLAYVGVSGFFGGFQAYMVEQLVNNTPQIRVAAREDYVEPHMLDEAFFGKDAKVLWDRAPTGVEGYLGVQNPQSWYARLAADPRVTAYTPLLIAGSVFSLGRFSFAGSLLGCEPLQQSKVTTIADYVTEGRFADLALGGNRIILGDELARRLGAGLGSYVTVTVGARPPATFKVAGKFLTGNRDQDMNAWAALGDVQRVNGTPHQVNRIAVRLNDPWQAAALATTWSKLLPERTESWDQLFVNIFAVFKIQNALRFSTIAAVVVVAGFGIYNVLMMTVNQKRQDVAILRSMGYEPLDIVSLFLLQGLIVGAIGSACGLVCGYALCRALQLVPFVGGPFGGRMGHLHVSLSGWIYAQAAAVAIGSAALASVFPARAAGKLSPIDIIRSGG